MSVVAGLHGRRAWAVLENANGVRIGLPLLSAEISTRRGAVSAMPFSQHLGGTDTIERYDTQFFTLVFPVPRWGWTAPHQPSNIAHPVFRAWFTHRPDSVSTPYNLYVMTGHGASHRLISATPVRFSLVVAKNQPLTVAVDGHAVNRISAPMPTDWLEWNYRPELLSYRDVRALWFNPETGQWGAFPAAMYAMHLVYTRHTIIDTRVSANGLDALFGATTRFLMGQEQARWIVAFHPAQRPLQVAYPSMGVGLEIRMGSPDTQTMYLRYLSPRCAAMNPSDIEIQRNPYLMRVAFQAKAVPDSVLPVVYPPIQTEVAP